jgi:hypothetical protein
MTDMTDEELEKALVVRITESLDLDHEIQRKIVESALELRRQAAEAGVTDVDYEKLVRETIVRTVKNGALEAAVTIDPATGEVRELEQPKDGWPFSARPGWVTAKAIDAAHGQWEGNRRERRAARSLTRGRR